MVRNSWRWVAMAAFAAVMLGSTLGTASASVASPSINFCGSGIFAYETFGTAQAHPSGVNWVADLGMPSGGGNMGIYFDPAGTNTTFAYPVFDAGGSRASTLTFPLSGGGTATFNDFGYSGNFSTDFIGCTGVSNVTSAGSGTIYLNFTRNSVDYRVPVTITFGAPPATACAPGTYSATGNEPCTPAPAGTYVATSGAIVPTACPVGTSSLVGATSCVPVQSLSILGGQGAVGSQDPNTQWSADVVAWDAGISSSGAWHFTGNANPVWRPAYRVSGHPWGQVPGTNTWMNCGPTTNSSECGASGGNVVAFRVRFSIPATLTGLNAKFWINSDNGGTYYLNGTQITDRLVGSSGRGGVALTPSGCVSGCSPYGSAGLRTAALATALQPGDNEMIVIVEDWGGLSGFNFRADITGLGGDPIVIVPPPPADSTPPVITPTVTGPLGTNGWYVGNVNVSWTVTDPNSAVTSQTGCGPITVTADTAGDTLTCTATSSGGTASQSVTVKRDATAPTASAAAAPAPNGAGWNNADVTVTFTGADGLSGIASCAAAVVLGEGVGQSASGTCTDQAGNVSAPASVSGINVDKTAPAVTVTGVTNGASYVIGGVPTAACGTTDALSGVATVATATIAGGPVGSVTVTCAGATDQAGNTSPAVTARYTITYSVCVARSGDHDDDEDDDRGGSRSKGHESGSTIPVKVRICDANGRNISSRSLQVKAIGLSPSGTLNDSGKSNPGNLFRLDDGTYLFNLSTKGLAAGAYTLDFTVGNDPTVYHYAFTVRPEKVATGNGKGDDKKDDKKDTGKKDR